VDTFERRKLKVSLSSLSVASTPPKRIICSGLPYTVAVCSLTLFGYRLDNPVRD
jgi:hypothetical protein